MQNGSTARARARRAVSMYGLAAVLSAATTMATAQGIPDVPRNRTLISQGWDFYNQVPSIDNFNPYAGVLLHMRNNLHYTVYESLFYTNHNTNERIPWLATGMETSDDFMTVTVNLREGVTWSDGEAFDADDVVYSLNMLKAESPGMLFSSAIDEWVESAEAVDPLTVTITLKKPGPRWAQDTLATGQASRFVVVPEHIWADTDASEFANFDLEAGLPVGTGPYRLVASNSSALTFDRRESWWAVETGFVEEMPKVERIVYVPGTQEAMPQLFASNQIDMGRSIQPGAYEAIRFQNPALVSWNEEGPVWGAPDGCTYALRFNNQVTPFDDANLRRAINYAIDRDQIVNLAYEGSVLKAMMPLSSYSGMLEYVDKIAESVDLEALDNPSVEKVAEHMEAGGYVKGDNGMWANADGSPLQLELAVAQGDPIGPVLSQQLKQAGFDALFKVMQLTAKNEAYIAGNYQMDVGPHCGALYDPWQTLEHFHSKYSAPAGESIKNNRAPTRYENPELDALLDQMEALQPSPDDPEYMELVRQAAEIFVSELPEISLAEELHTLVFNSTYWTGYPNAEDPYIAPYLPWAGFELVILNLEPTQ
ncbi:MAG: hypothetical protein CMH12_19690 [Maritimibacter sp.]|nr:hypothetical protein [Maritimibacter sp.]